jgi:hypothetical protein
MNIPEPHMPVLTLQVSHNNAEWQPVAVFVKISVNFVL